jgi:predicted enzyme related to lactoylglutathione lyase
MSDQNSQISDGVTKMNPVVHFEMPYEDRERMAKFYQDTFSWQAQMLGPEMGNYVVVHTTETDDKNMIKEPGRINGGFFKKDPAHAHPSVVIAVDDIQEAMKKVTEAGGTVRGGSQSMEPDNIPGIGLYVSIIDTEGNVVALLQPSSNM